MRIWLIQAYDLTTSSDDEGYEDILEEVRDQIDGEGGKRRTAISTRQVSTPERALSRTMRYSKPSRLFGTKRWKKMDVADNAMSKFNFHSYHRMVKVVINVKHIKKKFTIAHEKLKWIGNSVKQMLKEMKKNQETFSGSEVAMARTTGVLVDDNVLDVLQKAQLDSFVNKFVFLFNVRRFDHFSHIRDKDMQDIGMQQQQIRQLREQILKMSREMWNRSDPKQVYVAADQSTPVHSSIDEKALIPNEQIKLYEQLGEGSFAVVKRGTWIQSNGQHVDVAVKILRDISPNIMDDLRVEASHLLKLQHPSLIRLYGIVRQPAMMVFELCEGGSLLDRLRDDQKPIPLVSRLHDYCIQIAKALQFLESKHCVHGDVATRNILLAKDEKTVKICDFGSMSELKENERMYTMAPGKMFPFRWCPPEALRHRKFSHASDVWSYGVTMWEIFSFGRKPWTGYRAVDVLKNIDAGERLEKPKYCSERIYQIMKDCWKYNPAERCKFGAIREDLKASMFLDAIARETYNSFQPGTLQLVKGNEVVVVENTGQTWFGQNKENQLFGTFPRLVVFAQTAQYFWQNGTQKFVDKSEMHSIPRPMLYTKLFGLNPRNSKKVDHRIVKKTASRNLALELANNNRFPAHHAPRSRPAHLHLKPNNMRRRKRGKATKSSPARIRTE